MNPLLGRLQQWYRGDRLGALVMLALLGVLLYRFVLPRPSEPLEGLASQAIAPPGHVTLIELGATYCPACIAMKPVVFGLKQAYGNRIQVRVLDIDKPADRAEAQRMADIVHLRATPTLVVTDDRGMPRAKFIGTTSYAALAVALNQAMRRPAKASRLPTHAIAGGRTLGRV